MSVYEFFTESVEIFVENSRDSQIFRGFRSVIADCTNMVRPPPQENRHIISSQEARAKDESGTTETRGSESATRGRYVI